MRITNEGVEIITEEVLISADRRYEDQLFDPEVWNEPLAQFSKATGLTISLYDKNLERRGDVIRSGPIGERLAQSGFWSPQGLGAKIDLEAAAECLKVREPLFNVQFEIFSHLAIPLFVDQEPLAVFVIGWLPEQFADPVTCDLLSKRIQIARMEMWQLIRMQQPVSKEKLLSHARMLETFSTPLIRQLIVQIEERRRAQRSKVVSDGMIAFAESATEEETVSSALRTIQDLGPTTSVQIEIVRSKGEEQEVKRYGIRAGIDPISKSRLKGHLVIPIPSAQGHALGRLELEFAEPQVSEELVRDINSVASQLGTALQKVHLIEALENERSALKGANTQLKHLHKMKDEFLATVSHELRTPLNAILGWSQILREEGPNSPDHTQAMEIIERNARNQSNLIEDLLDVSRIISGKMSIERGNIEAGTLLQQSIQTVQPMIEARRQKLHLQLPEKAIAFKRDATRITQIFWNLLSNASKFTPEGGDISAVLENAGHYFKFEISDSGKGIASDFLPYLFDRFSQADGSYTRRHGGLGLGLAIVRHLVELHGGTIKATSAGEGKGSTFTIFLPRNTTDLELDNAQALSSQNLTSPKPSFSGVKILLVDDEPDSLRLTRFVLEKQGAQIQMADNAEEAFQMLREWRPDVLISDLSMPIESGYELIKRVRFLDFQDGGRVPAIALSALTSEESKNLAIRAGYHLHLSKPLEPNLLTAQISQLLHKSETIKLMNH